MKKHKVSRRNFLKLGSLGFAGAVLTLGHDAAAGMMGGGGGGGGGGGMGGGGTAVIDPPPGAAFRDPATAANMSTTPGMVEVSLDVREAAVRVGGARARLLTYNGLFPGPTIRAKKGGMLHVHLKNSLPKTTETNILGHRKNITNLHTHGLHVSPEPPA
ncbi:MAG TPA: multicopper oxidase domain-containing protein, partial [Nitrospirota bacterium]